MKAIDIINFINEDKFSKYTASQIYDELGHEDFFDYLENICTKIIKEFDTGIKQARPSIEITYNRIVYKSKHEKFNIDYADGHLLFDYFIGGSIVGSGYVNTLNTNIIPLLKRQLITTYNLDYANDRRRELKVT